MSVSLAGRVAVVTGGASGIGQACIELLEARGAKAHCIDLTGAEPLDVTNREALDERAAAIAAVDGGVDILVNAAGIFPPSAPFPEMPADGLRRALEVNLIGTFNAAQAFIVQLIERRGAIVNIASQSGLVATPNITAYGATKGAVIAFTRTLAIDMAPHGVRANAVAPGPVNTPVLAARFAANPDAKAAVSRRVPLGRVLEPSEIAAAIVFLASPEASAITGAILPVDGGWTAGEAMQRPVGDG